MNRDINEASTSDENERQGASAAGDLLQEYTADICLLCDKTFGELKTCVVKELGIENFIHASVKRKDRKDQILRNLKEITVHRTCQSMYIRKSNIQMALKSKAQKWTSDRLRTQEGRVFNFEKNCFFCSAVFQFHPQNVKSVTQHSVIENIITQLQYDPPSEINRGILSRVNELKSKTDEYYSQNIVKYHSTCLAKFYNYKSSNIRGKPITENMSSIVSYVIDYIVENAEECQFSLKSIVEQYLEIHGKTSMPRFDELEKHLKDHFQDEIEIFHLQSDRYVCFKQTLGRTIDDSWYSDRKTNTTEEKLRIVELAAHIVLQDIRSQVFEKNNYNSPADFLRGVTDEIPATLKTFLEILIKSHKKDHKNHSMSKWDHRATTAAHILMSSVRPRSFYSPVLLGLSCMIHTKFSARGLIDCLHNIGLCASYSETVQFENSIVNEPPDFKYISDPYLQFVYDNAEHNTATIDGKNTFHYMSGIMCVTPTCTVSFNKKTPRCKRPLWINNSKTSGFLPLTNFRNNNPFELNNITINEWNETVDFKIRLQPKDAAYFFGKFTAPNETPNWHGFMSNYHSCNDDFKTTTVIALPFIKAPASDHNTILTALIDARLRADKNDQKHCFVTFDLPLYIKASEIVASIEPNNDPHNLLSVIPRLGGFHCLVSFLGSIGHIMMGSGLKEAFFTIYDELSAEKSLTGHVYSKSIRGHLIVQAALATIIFGKVELQDDEKTFFGGLLEKIKEGNIDESMNDPLMNNVTSKFLSVVEKLENNGPTSQLWIQYFKLVQLVQDFIDAERSGNHELHLETIKKMTPFFFASGHHSYAKASLLYLQQMSKLRQIMDIFEYDKFCKQGLFTMRRSNRFWCGTWSDMTIERMFMRAMKGNGGLTHGRGLTENAIGKSILSRVAVLEVGNTMESFCNAIFSTSEQHVDNRISRLTRDAVDLGKVQQYFETYDPFPDTDKLIGIYSGVVADTSIVNCYKSFEIGKTSMDESFNKKFTDIVDRKHNKVTHLAAANSVMMLNVGDEEVHISPLLIFQKLTSNIRNQNNIQEYCSSYELAPIPLSLFDENGMRKTEKSAFYSNFHHTNELTSTGTVTHVVDGRFFIHKVVWQSDSKIEEIIKNYVAYAKRHYSGNSWIVFDGYPEDDTMSTKSVERSRKQMKNIGREIAFNNNTTITTNQKQFLNNEKNKSRLIDILCLALNETGFRTKVAPEDADRLIITTAIENARVDSETTVVIVGDDTDLLVILSQLAPNTFNICFQKESKGSDPVQFYRTDSFKSRNLQGIVAFLHAFNGCDTTSCFFRQGKNKLMNKVSEENLLKLASVFYNENANRDEIASSAFELIIKLYSDKADSQLMNKSSSLSLNDLRFLHFNKAKLENKFVLESLPPTEGAAKQHAFRVFYQVQLWLGNTNIKATDWGWQVKNNHLIPIGSSDPPIPKKLLQQISCSCTKECTEKSCGCKKIGLACTDLCVKCNDETCENFGKIEYVDVDDELSSAEEENDIMFQNNNPDGDDIAPPPKRRKTK